MNRRVHALAAALAVGVASIALTGCGGVESSVPAASSVPFDQAFIDAMVPHHEQAIVMAKDARATGLAQPALVKIADAIIASQGEEIEQMKAWRSDWFGSDSIDPAGADALGMSMDEMGMATTMMDFASENDVDGAFAAMMIDHHKGAIAMAELALEKADHPEILALAKAIMRTQQQEIDALQAYADSGHQMSHAG